MPKSVKRSKKLGDLTLPERGKGYTLARNALKQWQKSLRENIYSRNRDFQHSIGYFFPEDFERIQKDLERFGEAITCKLEPLVAENDFKHNHPRLEAYSSIGERTDEIVHHPTYIQAGNIIYGSRMMEKISQPGKMLESLLQFFLSSHAGEAGHNCPLACTAGILRVLTKIPDFPEKSFLIDKLTDPNFESNYTSAQFITEIQGGSDVGLNETQATLDSDGIWRISGEKWFCSNADADLILVTARYDKTVSGTKGLGLFLIPARLPNGENNDYTFRRLKEKVGTRTLASAEIDFEEAFAYPMGEVKNGFKMLMENVLHISRIFNTCAAIGTGNRAYQIALSYVKHRIAFGEPVFNYPLVKENLARIKTENTALLSSILAMTRLQDQYDSNQLTPKETPLLLRVLANLNKYISALWTFDHVHHSIDMMGGNGAIESFSSLPRLLRDSIVFENWEGTHNTLRMQILRDIHKSNIDQIYVKFMEQQLREIEDEPEWTEPLRVKLEELKQQLEKLKASGLDLQSLLIKDIIDVMATLFCALTLFLEGKHQRERTESSSKLDCLRYFILLHFHPTKIVYDEEIISLITKIVAD